MLKEVCNVFQQEHGDLFRLFNKLPVAIKVHSRFVADMAVQIFSWAGESDLVEDMEPYTAEMIHKAVLFHDIGFSVNPTLVFGSGIWNDDEKLLYQNHTIYGGKLIELYRMLNVSPDAERNLWLLATEISVSHHERWDGKGYPYGSITTAVPLAARIVAIANDYDDLIRGKSAGRGVPVNWAMKQLAKGAGTRFDPKLVEIVLSNFKII